MISLGYFLPALITILTQADNCLYGGWLQNNFYWPPNESSATFFAIARESHAVTHSCLLEEFTRFVLRANEHPHSNRYARHL